MLIDLSENILKSLEEVPLISRKQLRLENIAFIPKKHDIGELYGLIGEEIDWIIKYEKLYFRFKKSDKNDIILYGARTNRRKILKILELEKVLLNKL